MLPIIGKAICECRTRFSSQHGPGPARCEGDEGRSEMRAWYVGNLLELRGYEAERALTRPFDRLQYRIANEPSA